MKATTTRKTVKAERMSRMGLLTEPAGYVEGANLYEYVGSNPTDRVDPLGFQSATTQPTTGPTTQPVNPIDKDKSDAGTKTKGPPGV